MGVTRGGGINELIRHSTFCCLPCQCNPGCFGPQQRSQGKVEQAVRWNVILPSTVGGGDVSGVHILNSRRCAFLEQDRFGGFFPTSCLPPSFLLDLRGKEVHLKDVSKGFDVRTCVGNGAHEPHLRSYHRIGKAVLLGVCLRNWTLIRLRRALRHLLFRGRPSVLLRSPQEGGIGN